MEIAPCDGSVFAFPGGPHESTDYEEGTGRAGDRTSLVSCSEVKSHASGLLILSSEMMGAQEEVNCAVWLLPGLGSGATWLPHPIT